MTIRAHQVTSVETTPARGRQGGRLVASVMKSVELTALIERAGMIVVFERDGQPLADRDSRESLGLSVGAPAFALVKASSIILMTDTEYVRLSTRNQFAGTVKKVVPGAVNTEVLLDVAGGVGLAVIVTNESARALELAEGSAATAVLKASSVIVGVNA